MESNPEETMGLARAEREEEHGGSKSYHRQE